MVTKPKHQWMVRETFIGDEKYFETKSRAIDHIKKHINRGHSRIWLEKYVPKLYDPAGPLWMAFKHVELWENVDGKPKMTRSIYNGK